MDNKNILNHTILPIKPVSCGTSKFHRCFPSRSLNLNINLTQVLYILFLVFIGVTMFNTFQDDFDKENYGHQKVSGYFKIH